jgi:polyhydroxyalkanoate synthesis regulator phasin
MAKRPFSEKLLKRYNRKEEERKQKIKEEIREMEQNYGFSSYIRKRKDQIK